MGLRRNIAAPCLSALLLLGACSDPAGPAVVPAAELRPGVLLVANRALSDPRFRRSVVLLVRHGPHGSYGLIINRPTEVALRDLLPPPVQVAGTQRVFIGGPVAPFGLSMLRRGGGDGRGLEPVFDDVWVSNDRSVIEQALENAEDDTRVRFYAGYAGWAPGQLERERGRGDWWLLQADPSFIFGADHERLWADLIEQVDPPGVWVRSEQVAA